MPHIPNPPPDSQSSQASGTLDGYDPYRQTPYRHTISPRRLPYPFHSADLADRPQAFVDINAIWQSLTAAQQSTWLRLAHAENLPAYNAFMRSNLLRFLAGLSYLSTP